MKAVSQKELTQELGVTDRRICQLVAEKILPEPTDHGYDLEMCRYRYQLYSLNDEYSWAEFDRSLLEDAHQVEKLMKKAFRPSAKRNDLAAAAQAHVAVFDGLRFSMTARSKKPAGICAADAPY